MEGERDGGMCGWMDKCIGEWVGELMNDGWLDGRIVRRMDR